MAKGEKGVLQARSGGPATQKTRSSSCALQVLWDSSYFNNLVSRPAVPPSISGSFKMITDSVFICFHTWTQCCSARKFTDNWALSPAVIQVPPTGLRAKTHQPLLLPGPQSTWLSYPTVQESKRRGFKIVKMPSLSSWWHTMPGIG